MPNYLLIKKYNGTMCQILNPPTITMLGHSVNISIVDGSKIWNTGESWTTYKTSINIPEGKKWGGFMLLLLLIIRELNGIVIIIMK